MEPFRVDFNVLSGNSTSLLLHVFFMTCPRTSHISGLFIQTAVHWMDRELLKTSFFHLHSSWIKTLFSFIAFLARHFSSIPQHEGVWSYYELFLPFFKAGIQGLMRAVSTYIPASACNATCHPSKEESSRSHESNRGFKQISCGICSTLRFVGRLSVPCVPPRQRAQDFLSCLKNLSYVNTLTGHLPEHLKSRWVSFRQSTVIIPEGLHKNLAVNLQAFPAWIWLTSSCSKHILTLFDRAHSQLHPLLWKGLSRGATGKASPCSVEPTMPPSQWRDPMGNTGISSASPGLAKPQQPKVSTAMLASSTVEGQAPNKECLLMGLFIAEVCI